MIKIFYCKRTNCKFEGTRKDLRKHLRDEHLIKKEKTNFENVDGKTVNQQHWGWREFK